MDSDVEVLKSFDDLLQLPYFIGEERGGNIEPAIIGCEKGWNFLGQMLSYYENRHFIVDGECDMQTLPAIMSEEIRKHYEYHKISKPTDFLIESKLLNVLPADFFSPKFPNEFKCPISSDTYTIHHFEASWYPVDKKVFRLIRKLFGYKTAHFISIIIKGIKNIILK